MRIRELGHVVLYVKNLERSARFYRDVLGFRAIDTPERMRGTVMAFSSGRTHHELLLIAVGENAPHPGSGHRAGLYHIGLKVGDRDGTSGTPSPSWRRHECRWSARLTTP